MTTIPSKRFPKTKWLNFHCHNCSSLITNHFKTRTFGDLKALRLNKKPNVWIHFLEPLNILDCGIRDVTIQNFIMIEPGSSFHNNPYKCPYFMWNKQQDSPGNIAHGIIETVHTLKSNYNIINIGIAGILPVMSAGPLIVCLLEKSTKF